MSDPTFPAHVERWAALRTAARWEKKLADTLRAAGVPAYLPLADRLTPRRAVERPVFPGYVFCSEPDFLTGRRVGPDVRRKVAQVLRPPDPGLLRRELAEVAAALADRRRRQERLAGRVGDAVRVTAGALAGYEGEVVRVVPTQRRLVLRVSFLAAEVVLDDRLVERVV